MTVNDPVQTYRQEAAELLEQLEQTLLDLDRTPDDHELIDTAFRALHTIKGSGAMFGFERMAAFAHHVETAFDRVRKGQVQASRPLIAVALAAKDQIRCLIEQPELASDAAGARILEELHGVVAADAPVPDSGAPGAADAAPPKPAAGMWRLRFRLPVDAMSLGTNPLLLLDELRALGPCTVVADTTAVPSLDELEPTACHIGWEVMLSTTQPRSAIEEIFLFVLDGMQLDIEDLSLPVAAPAASTTAVAAATARNEPASGRDAGSIRVPADRLDALMDRVGELVIAQSRLKQLDDSQPRYRREIGRRGD